jgi:hypothetical protein
MGQLRFRPSRHVRCEGVVAALAIFFSGCYGDFGRPRPTVFFDRSAWVGNEAARALDEPASLYPLTDEETLLRELAYPLIRPPYSRQRWYVVLGEFRRRSVLPYRYGEIRDYQVYALKLLGAPYRSPSARYAQLLEDVRNDLLRIDRFVIAAFRVVDLDRKREKSLAFVSGLTVEEAANAAWRVRENAMILAWVQHCLGERAAWYRYALERLIIAMPSPQGVDVERVLIELERRIADLYPGLDLAPVPAAVVAK